MSKVVEVSNDITGRVISYAPPGKDWTGYSIVVGCKDGSVMNWNLGAAKDGNATLAPDSSGQNIFERAGPHEVLDIEK